MPFSLVSCKSAWCTHVQFFYRGMQISVHIYIFYNIEIIANTQPRVIEFAQTPIWRELYTQLCLSSFFSPIYFPLLPPQRERNAKGWNVNIMQSRRQAPVMRSASVASHRKATWRRPRSPHATSAPSVSRQPP